MPEENYSFSVTGIFGNFSVGGGGGEFSVSKREFPVALGRIKNFSLYASHTSFCRVKFHPEIPMGSPERERQTREDPEEWVKQTIF